MTESCTFPDGYCMTFPISRYVIARITSSKTLTGNAASIDINGMNNGWFRRSTTNHVMEFVKESNWQLKGVYKFDHYYDYFTKTNADVRFINT